MSAKLSLYRGFITANLLLAACSSAPYHPAQNQSESSGYYYSSAFNDRNRAPASMSPPAVSTEGSDQLDPVYLRTQADYHFQVGEAHSLDGQHQKAVESFKTVLIYDPGSAQVHLRLSAEYVKLGMLTQGLEHAEMAVKKDAKSVDAKILLAGLLSTLKVYDKALYHYEQVLKLDPSNTEAPMYIGAVYAEQKKFDKAAKYFESLAKNDDYSTPHIAWYYLGRIRSEQNGKAFEKAAEAAYKKALSLKPQYIEALLALGTLYTKNGNEGKAIDLYKNYQREHGPNSRLAGVLADYYLEQEQYDLAYEQLEVLESQSDDNLNAKLRMALALMSQKKFEMAIVKLKEVLKLVPDSDKIRFYLAAVYEEMNKPEEAIDQFNRVPVESQYYSESVVHAAFLSKQIGKLDSAISIIKKGLEKRDDVAQFYAIYASLLDEKGDYHQASHILEVGSKKFPENVQLRFFLGTVADRLGDKSKVIESMKKVIDMDPNHVQGLNYLAFTYAESNTNLDEAEGLVRRALQMEPNDGYILDTLGWILYKKGKFQESIKVLEAAVRNQPNESIIAEHLGDAYQKHQLVDKARAMYQRAADSETNEKKLKEIREKISALESQQMKYTNRQPASVKKENSEEKP